MNIKKKVLTGVLFGLLSTAFGFYCYSQVFNQYSIRFLERLIFEQDMLGEIIAYSVMPNLLTFFVFIKRKEDYKARGVILATLAVAVVFLISFAM